VFYQGQVSNLIFRQRVIPAEINSLNPDSCIRIYNNGTAKVTILRLKNITETGDISSFQYDRGALLTTLDPGEERIVPVFFHPTLTGPHILTFEYVTNPPISNVTTTLQGVGTVPRLKTDDVIFGATNKDDYENYITHQVTFTNMSIDEWQYGDSVTITDFTENNIHTEISQSWNMFPEPFRFDKDFMAFSFPIILQPGSSMTFDGDFVAKSDGHSIGTLTTVSDAESDVTSVWRGWSVGTGVNDELAGKIKILPNPANDKIILSGLKEGLISIKIYDVLGNEMNHRELLITNDQLLIDTRNFKVTRRK